MKKRLLLLILLIPLVNAIDCITYDDCIEPLCAGASRLCVDGNCVRTPCFATEDSRDLDKIIQISGRILLFAIILLVAALLFPMLRLHSKAKFIAIAGFSIAAILFGLYLFGGDELPFLQETWDSERADSEVRIVIEKENYDLIEELIRPSTPLSKNGKEYKLRSPIHENTILAMKISSGTEQEIIPDYALDKEVYTLKTQTYSNYAWKREDILYIVSGIDAEEIMELLLENRTEIPDQPTFTTAPVIRLISPNTTIVRDRQIVFDVYDSNSEIQSITIQGKDAECYIENNVHKCTYTAELAPGRNDIMITAYDESAPGTKRLTLIYDIYPWHLELIYPEDRTYINVANIHFKVLDEESGIDHVDITGLGNQDCNEVAYGIECKFEQLNLPEGEIIVNISGKDNAGNQNSKGFSFFFDKTRPIIELTTKGFIVSDNIMLNTDSLMIDNKKYGLDNCYLIGSRFHCKYDDWIREISIMDMAGNRATKENKLQR